MNSPYNPADIETKWQKQWFGAASNLYSADDATNNTYYCLDMFPYPSGAGLHVGHPEGYTATDILSRYKRMNGFNVLHPMGWDAFGLPAENYAIKTGVHPAESTAANITTFKRQIQSLGFSYDWEREINTSDPSYYKWTQWLFLQLYNAGLAYKKKAKVNWCETDQTVLANEQVEDGKCERCKNDVIQKDLEQWFFKITDYADQLLNDLEGLDWPEPIKAMQRNWIGRSEGTELEFKVKDSDQAIRVYTTRVDTIYSAAFVVLAPEHPLVQQVTTEEQRAEVEAYQTAASLKNELERTSLDKAKTGAFTGAYAINPVTQQEIPVWVGDFVIASYGTGALFGDAHDERDFVFAQTYNIPLTVSIRPSDDALWARVQNFDECYTDDGVLVNSGEFNGQTSAEARKNITAWLAQHGAGEAKVTFRIRDWLVSRQRYWGAPIPVVYDPAGQPHAVKPEHLPLILPTDVDYRPKGTSPIGSSDSYKKLAEELYGEGWRFETDTMDTFVCSSWYYLRFCDPNNTEEFANAEKLAHWLPVDMYVGGAEHAVLHLLYARFFHKALQDLKLIPAEVGREPFKALRNQGMILGEDHQKMSKSRGNVVNPDDVTSQYGADTLRLYEMFMGPFEDVKPWNTESIKGVYRFLDKAYKLTSNPQDKPALPETEQLLHKTIKQVTEDIESFRFNTAISAMMILVNHLTAAPLVSKATLLTFIQLLQPFAPHVAQEMWEKLGNTSELAKTTWPTYDPAQLVTNEVTVVVQVLGKVRGKLVLPINSTEADAMAAAQAEPNVQKYLEGTEIVKVIYIQDKLLNIVIK